VSAGTLRSDHSLPSPRYNAGHMSFDPPASGSFPQAPPAPSLVGEVIDGRYRIFKKLGEGGMGEVYAAEHVHIEKRFALKLLKAEIVSNNEAVKRFQQEARSSSSIKHRNIIAVEDFGRLPDGRIYMCMELLGGLPLNEMIQQPMAADRLLNILIQSGHGLAAAHSKGIIHRDMKPENIYVTHDASGDVPKLLDFGIAKVAGNDGQNNLTRTGTIFGTPFYMAPEQALGNPVDARTDIYAMGVIMYECFAGSLPFQGESFMGILTQHITTDPEPVAQRAAKAGRSLPHGIADIITRCMQKDPKQRFQTMDELVNALIGVYRTIAGAGMSTYMEAFPVGHTGHIPSPTPPPMTGGQAAQYGSAQAPTLAVGSAAGYQHPTPGGYQQPAGYQHPTPGQSQPVMQPQVGSGPSAAISSSASGLYDPSASAVVVKKSKAPLIIALALLVAVGGGIAAVMLLSKKDNKTGDGSGSQVVDDKGSNDVVTPPDKGGSGSQVATNDPPPDKGSGDTQANGGSDATNDQGSGNHTNSDGSATLPPKPDTVDVAVFTEPFVNDFEIWEDGKKVQDGDEDVAITPGTPRKIVVKAKGFKDSKPIVVDGKKTRVRVKLEAKGGVVRPPDPKPPGIDCSATIKDPKNKKCIAQFCGSHPDDMRCDAE
jgi:eukaryotic-like serine/threonine-protein kinase